MTTHPAIATMLRGQQAALAGRVPPVEPKVEYQPDVSEPGRTVVTIIGPTYAAVQHEITRCMNAAEDMGNSFCEFLNPMRSSDGAFVSRGVVIVAQPSTEVVG